MKFNTLIAIVSIQLFYFSPVFSQNEDFKSLSEKGMKYNDEQDYSKAIEFFEKAFSIGTENEEDLLWVSINAGICAQQANEPLKVLSFFQIAIDLKSPDQDLYDQFFNIAEQQKDQEKQEYVLVKALENGLNKRKYLTKLVNFYYQTGQYDKTIQAIDEFLKVVPKSVAILTMKAISLEMTKQYDNAILVYEDILSDDPENKIAISNLGMVYYNKGNMIYDSASADYMKMKNPTKEQYTEMTKKFDHAAVFYRQAVKLLEKSSPEKHIKDALSKSYTRIRNAEKANILN